MEWTVPESLAAQAIGRAVLDNLDRESLARAVNAAALELLEEIRVILNDDGWMTGSAFTGLTRLYPPLTAGGLPLPATISGKKSGPTQNR